MIQNEDPVIANSLWTATANVSPVYSPLQTQIDADVVVIGAGFTGLSAALHLAQSGINVVVLEAETPGWGASGRNGGQVNPGLIENPNHAITKFGSKMGHRMIEMSGAAAGLVFDLIEKHNIKCDPRPVGWVRAAHNKRSLRHLEERARQWDTHGETMQRLNSSEIAQLLGTEAYVGGIIDLRGGNIHPLNYALGLADAALADGAQIYGHSKVETLTSANQLHKLTTQHGCVCTKRILVCTNGYSDDLIPGLRQSVVPIRSIQVATKPLSDNIRASVLPGLHAPSDTRHLLLYFRTDAEGRFIMGARGAYSAEATRSCQAEARAVSKQLFPQLGAVEWDYHWGGYIAATSNNYPQLNDFGNGITAGLGYNGRGVAMATAMGKVLADFAIGVPVADLDFPVTPLHRLPFHQFHRLGVTAKVAKYKLMDRLGL